MESTPLREAVRKTQLDLTLSGIKYNKFRNYNFDPETNPISTTIRGNNAKTIPRPLQAKKLPAIPLRYHQSLECLPSKTPLPLKKSCSPTINHGTRSSSLERQRTSITNPLRRSGSLSTLPTANSQAVAIRPLIDNYGVGQPELKLPRTPRNVTPKRNSTQFADPYTQYCAIGLGRAQSTFKAHRAAMGAFQSSPKGSLTPVTTRHTRMPNTQEQRYRIAKEIENTEATYVQNLHTLTSFFYRPLLKAKLIPQNELKQLFPPQLNALLNCHIELLDKLHDRLSNSKWHGMIGDLFANLCPGSMSMDFFQMYSGYVLAFPSALAVYDKQIRTNEEFRGFIRACMESPSCRGLDLCAFLLTPIQRLPRYLLLLKELIKYTDSSHPDSYFANLAADKFKACLVLLNDSIHLVLDIASKSSAWQNEPRAKSATNRGGKTSKKAKRNSKRVSGISHAGSNSDLESNSSSLYVESCPPSFFNNFSNHKIQSPIIHEKQNRSAQRVLKLDPPPEQSSAMVYTTNTEQVNTIPLETRKLTLQLSIEDKIPFSSPPLTSNKSHTDSGIYEEDPDLPQPDEIPAFQPHTPIPEHPGYHLPSLPDLDITATRNTSGQVESLTNCAMNNLLLESPVQRITEIGIINEADGNVKNKKHIRRRSADRILRLFKIFKSK
ncbi:hypothetical protein LOD99_13441 [Oopsacas minuta]|uniref:DH domain-containing protein n=1 Tax=Oopsacas minuta TaxID=111878 RepID=A0AAV7KL34_9METZ|nr:hypothetical protein LOD99_13441 [Oopsacas minuta]